MSSSDTFYRNLYQGKLFDPVRKGYDDPRETFPYSGYARVSANGLKRRLNRFIQEYGDIDINQPDFARNLATQMDDDLPDRLAVLLERISPEALWALPVPQLYNRQQTHISASKPALYLLEHLMMLPAMSERCIAHGQWADKQAKIAEAIGSGLAFTPEMGTVTDLPWTIALGEWINRNEPQWAWVTLALDRKPDLVYARPLLPRQGQGPQSHAALPILLTAGPGDAQVHWDRWIAWGGQPEAKASEETVPGLTVPDGMSRVFPETISVGIACAMQGQGGAVQWVHQNHPEMFPWLNLAHWHRALQTPDDTATQADPQTASQQLLKALPEHIWDGPISPLWSLARGNPDALFRDTYRSWSSSGIEPISTTLGITSETFAARLAEAKDLEGHDLWWAIFAGKPTSNTLEHITQSLLKLEIIPQVGPDALLLGALDAPWQMSQQPQASFDWRTAWSVWSKAYPEAILGGTPEAQAQLAAALWEMTPSPPHMSTLWAHVYAKILMAAEDYLSADLRSVAMAMLAISQPGDIDSFECAVQKIPLNWPQTDKPWLAAQAEKRVSDPDIFLQSARREQRQNALAGQPIPSQRRRMRG